MRNDPASLPPSSPNRDFLNRNAPGSDHAHPHAHLRPRASRRRRRAAHAAACLLLAGAALAAVVRLTLRDRWPVLSALFYATPPLVIALAALLASAAAAAARRRPLALLALLGAAGAAWWGVATGFVHRPPQHCADSVRVMFWNVNRGWLGWDAIAEHIRAADADVVGLVEARFDDPAAGDALAAALPEYAMLDPVFGIMLLSRGECLQVVDDWLPPAGKYRRVSLRVGSSEFEAWVVDLESNPLGARADTLRRVARKLAYRRDRPVVLMGDFNTPSDSIFFEPLRAQAANAFESAGSGYAATWPIPAPVLTLDQVWTNPLVEPLCTRLDWSWRSDHRAVVVDVGVTPTP